MIDEERRTSIPDVQEALRVHDAEVARAHVAVLRDGLEYHPLSNSVLAIILMS